MQRNVLVYSLVKFLKNSFQSNLSNKHSVLSKIGLLLKYWIFNEKTISNLFFLNAGLATYHPGAGYNFIPIINWQSFKQIPYWLGLQCSKRKKKKKNEATKLFCHEKLILNYMASNLYTSLFFFKKQRIENKG